MVTGVEEGGCSNSCVFIWVVASQEVRSYPVSWLCRKKWRHRKSAVIPFPGCAGRWLMHFILKVPEMSVQEFHVEIHGCKRKALKLNFANPSTKPSTRFSLNTAGPPFQNPHIERLRTHSIESSGKLKISPEQHWDFTAEDLKDLGEIGRGAYGSVNKMVHKPSNMIMAVKRIRSTVDEKEQKQLLMDLDVVMRSSDCPYIVQFYGALFREGDCWICMELMATSLDKFYKFVYGSLDDVIPEEILGKITLATVKALNHLKENLKIIHRDIKPSNILLDRNGNIKLCDFGISGQLVDSIAKTRDAGCRPYMAPERIDPSASRQGYDVRSDVWSLGITL
ncbi:Dual specificity mitogen-activated protein kinase kinase 4, partial [Characodon lateralis]|nr:Dual specificity mitogen-activated protein kinase kinase 4 [Characodon lateralis]